MRVQNVSSNNCKNQRNFGWLWFKAPKNVDVYGGQFHHIKDVLLPGKGIKPQKLIGVEEYIVHSTPDNENLLAVALDVLGAEVKFLNKELVPVEQPEIVLSEKAAAIIEHCPCLALHDNLNVVV